MTIIYDRNKRRCFDIFVKIRRQKMKTFETFQLVIWFGVKFFFLISKIKSVRYIIAKIAGGYFRRKLANYDDAIFEFGTMNIINVIVT